MDDLRLHCRHGADFSAPQTEGEETRRPLPLICLLAGAFLAAWLSGGFDRHMAPAAASPPPAAHLPNF
ncbi:MAG TPA: hypothetical protein VME92_11060 [Acetobacteraceae bacterium]|nr:hypothetical protein [Acetobacteraceae bacterium]